jgi:opacity protein-like surface antigen
LARTGSPITSGCTLGSGRTTGTPPRPSRAGFGQSLSSSESGTDFGWGVGLGTTWDNIALRLEYESVPIEQIDAAFLSLSLAWNFGGRDRHDRYSDRPVASQATQQPVKDGVRVYE